MKMGLISGIFMGVIFGIALMAGWQHMMRHRSTKRVAKVRYLFCVFLDVFGVSSAYLAQTRVYFGSLCMSLFVDALSLV